MHQLKNVHDLLEQAARPVQVPELVITKALFEFLTEPTDSIEKAFAAGEGRVFFPLWLPGDPLNQYFLGEKNSLGEGVNTGAVSVIVLASQVTMGGKAEIETW